VRHKSIWLAALAIACLVYSSPLAAASVIHRGVDTFTTLADGNTFYDFAQQPIPVGFFCAKSESFGGRLVLKGLPLATAGAGRLNGSDTIIERLDDAIFDDNNHAVTRIQFKALSLVSSAPIQTRCGAFHVYVSLAGKQRQTVMRISRTSEKGGTFTAPLAVSARMTFIPVERSRGAKARNLELLGSFTFPAVPISWRYDNSSPVQLPSSVAVDTNGDQIPDSLVVGTPNFVPAGSTKSFSTKLLAGCVSCPGHIECHIDSNKQHCTTLVVCDPDTCPDDDPPALVGRR
jgi:hypothetical protein